MIANITLSVLVLMLGAWLFIAICFGALLSIFDVGSWFTCSSYIFFLPVLVVYAYVIRKPLMIMFPDGLPFWMLCAIFALVFSAGPLYLIWS
jgi:hypothetical protein